MAQPPPTKPIARRHLVKYLKTNGWELLRQQGSHEVWKAPNADFHMVLPKRKGSTLIGQPFLRQIQQAMAGEVISRARRS